MGDSWGELILRSRIESRAVRMPTLLRDVGMAPNAVHDLDSWMRLTFQPNVFVARRRRDAGWPGQFVQNWPFSNTMNHRPVATRV